MPSEVWGDPNENIPAKQRIEQMVKAAKFIAAVDLFGLRKRQ